MAERQETSVMASIQDILRDAQSREEQEKIEAERRVREEEQRRLDDVRRKQEQEQARLRAEEEERQRRTHEEQRRQAELQAVQEAALQKARMEAEAQARLAELTSRQEHERHLHALSHDKSKKGLQMGLAALGVLLLALAVGGGVMIARTVGERNALELRAHDLELRQEQAEGERQRLQRDLENAKDPEKIAALKAELGAAQQKIEAIKGEATGNTRRGPAAAPVPRPPQGQTPRPACTCQAGDPLCSCL